MAEPDRDDADVIGRLLMRVYEIHERVIARGELVAVQTIKQIAEWFKGLVAMPASEET